MGNQSRHSHILVKEVSKPMKKMKEIISNLVHLRLNAIYRIFSFCYHKILGLSTGKIQKPFQYVALDSFPTFFVKRFWKN